VSVIVVLVLTALQAASLPSAAQTATANLSAAKAAYADAAYEDALAFLSKADAAGDATQVLQYRALCLLALARPAEAQQTVELLVSQKPLYRLSDAETPPRLLTMFRAARQRLLPALARDLYVKAKSSYDQKQLDAALAQFKDLSAVLSDPDMSAQAPGVADLKTLGDGFLRLTEAELAQRSSAPDAPTVTEPLGPASPIPGAVKVVFSDEDKDVRPPVELMRKMPEWSPPTNATRQLEYHGVLEIFIDELGVVTGAQIRETVSTFYDAALIKAAREWRYKPAMRNGQPVKYRKLIGISLKPGG